MEAKLYAANVQFAQANAALFTKMQQDYTMALTNLATATQADRILVALLTKKIAELTTQITYLTSKLLTEQSDKLVSKYPDIARPAQVSQ